MTIGTAAAVIDQLKLVRHPEGGWYRETYRASLCLAPPALPLHFSGERAASTAIYFLLERGEVSALHRIKSDELWHFHAGSTLTLHCIDPAGDYRCRRLGSDLAAGETFQAVVPAGCWFGAEVTGSGPYALVGCTVAPGFDFADFELGEPLALCRQFPQHARLIDRLQPRPPGAGHRSNSAGDAPAFNDKLEQ